MFLVFSHWKKKVPLFLRSLQPFFYSFFLSLFYYCVTIDSGVCVCSYATDQNVSRVFDGWGASCCVVIPFIRDVMRATIKSVYIFFFLPPFFLASCCYFIEWINEPPFFFFSCLCVVNIIEKKKMPTSGTRETVEFFYPQVLQSASAMLNKRRIL
jgi:hypothetical protein